MMLQGTEFCQSSASFVRPVWAEGFFSMFAASILMKYWLSLINESTKKNSWLTVQILDSWQSWEMYKVSMSVCNADLWYFITMKMAKKGGKISEICFIPECVLNALYKPSRKIAFCWVGFFNVILVVTSAFYAITWRLQ